MINRIKNRHLRRLVLLLVVVPLFLLLPLASLIDPILDWFLGVLDDYRAFTRAVVTGWRAQ
jgi:hypothetical protein